MIKTLKEHIVCDNGFVKMHNDLVQFPDGHRGYHFKINTSHTLPDFGVVGLIITNDDHIILFNNYRYAHQNYSLETVKGFGIPNKTPKQTFIQEIKEETGYKSDCIEFLNISQESSQAYTTYLFIAHHCYLDSKTAHEATEIIKDIQLVSKEQALSMVQKGDIVDPCTVLLIQTWLLRDFL